MINVQPTSGALGTTANAIDDDGFYWNWFGAWYCQNVISLGEEE